MEKGFGSGRHIQEYRIVEKVNRAPSAVPVRLPASGKADALYLILPIVYGLKSLMFPL